MENTEIIMNKLKPIYDAVVNDLSEQGSIKDLCYMSIPLSDLLRHLIDINDIIPSDTVNIFQKTGLNSGRYILLYTVHRWYHMLLPR